MVGKNRIESGYQFNRGVFNPPVEYVEHPDSPRRTDLPSGVHLVDDDGVRPMDKKAEPKKEDKKPTYEPFNVGDMDTGDNIYVPLGALYRVGNEVFLNPEPGLIFIDPPKRTFQEGYQTVRPCRITKDKDGKLIARITQAESDAMRRFPVNRIKKSIPCTLQTKPEKRNK